LVAFMAGALYSLGRAIQCRFNDARMVPEMQPLATELVDVLSQIEQSKEPPRPWLSGYFIDSAMMRIAALGERLGKQIGPAKPLGPEVPNAVNSMKHAVDAGITEGWEVRFAHVLRDAEVLWPILAKAVPGSSEAAV